MLENIMKNSNKLSYVWFDIFKGGHTYLLSVSFRNHYIGLIGPTLLLAPSLKGGDVWLVGDV